jgi:multidrug efflux system membrane fusion protein
VTRRIIIGAIASVICLAGLSAWRLGVLTSAPRAASAPPLPVPVVAEKVQVSDVPMVMVGIGTVEAYNIVDIHAQVTGTIEKLGFVEGQTVHRGDLIAQIDPRPYQAALQQAQAQLARDQAHLGNAQLNLRRYSALNRDQFASDQQVANEASQVAQMQAAVASDRAAIFNAQTQLSYTTITSPIDGVTGIRHIDIGNIIQPSTSTPVVNITQIQPISVVFTLPQKDLPTIQEAMAKGTLQTIAYDQDDRTKLATGTLLLVNNNTSQSAGTVQLKATFPNKHGKLWPGQFVNVRLIVSVQHNAVTIPLSALQQGQNGSTVYVVEQNGSVQQRSVTITETLSGRALIEHGLQAAGTVVTAGQYLLKDGVKVVEVPPNDPRVQNTTEASAGML